MEIINEFLEVKKSGIHNRGVYARKDIAKGKFIVEYTGKKVSKEEGTRIETETSKKGYTYIFELNDEWDIDGDDPNNGAKYINHSCNPNCEIVYKDNRIWIVAKRDIAEGEELSYNYGFEFEDDNQKCACGSNNCVGYILDEEDWPKLKEAKKKG
jgi:uncharacterized protein